MSSLVLTPLASLGRFASFSAGVASRLITGPWYLTDTAKHLWLTFQRCFLPVAAVVLPFGMVMALQGLSVFELFGAHRLLGSLVSASVLRELSPVLASVLVAAQGGSAVAAELASMRIKEELDASEVMAVDSISLHVIPRILGLALACPLLHLVGSVAGITGGYIVAVWIKGEQSGVFLAEMWAFSTPLDLYAGLIKTCVFGVIIGFIAAYHGFNAKGGAAGVGRAVNDTVVHTVTAFIAANYFLSSALFGGVG